MTLRPVDPEKMRHMEATCREIGEIIGHAIANVHGLPNTGFALMLFSFEGAELTYISNANREDMLRMLQEFIGANPPPLRWDEQHG